MRQINFKFSHKDALNYIFVCTGCETPLICHDGRRSYCPVCKKFNSGKWVGVDDER